MYLEETAVNPLKFDKRQKLRLIVVLPIIISLSITLGLEFAGSRYQVDNRDQAVGNHSIPPSVAVLLGNYALTNTANATFSTPLVDPDLGGCAIASAGDVNDDGYADVLVGVSQYDFETGRVYLFYGNGSANAFRGDHDLDSAANATFTGAGPSSCVGYAVAGVGDVNGDGYADFLIGAVGPSTPTGVVYLIYGNGSGNLLQGDYLLPSAANATFTGAGSSNYFGDAVAGAGDVNGDGYADFLVGAPWYSSNTGQVYLVYGNGSGNALLGNYNLASAANATFTGAGSNNYAGDAVAGAGDVNGDGYADLLVGAQGCNSFTGKTYLVYGNGSGNALHGNYNLASAANATFTGVGSNNYAGYAVAGAGDVNGDEYADILVGAIGYNTFAGQAYLIYGNASGNALLGNYNLASGANATFTGGGNNYRAGTSTAGAGDVNGDGYADLLVGAQGYNSYTGQAYLVYGNGSGNALLGDYNLASAANATFTGEGTDNNAGEALAGAGDVNGDGIADLLIAAHGSDTGRVYLFYGTEVLNYPARIVDLEAVYATPSSISLSWTAPGDDGWEGIATGYIMKMSINPINASNWDFATIIAFPPSPAASGTVQSCTVTNLNPDTTYYFAIKAVDDEGLSSPLSNTPHASTLDSDAPMIISPPDITYFEGDVESHQISWPITDSSTNNPTYSIRVNWGIPTAPNGWISGSQVTYDVGGWVPGRYYVEISVTDGYGQNVTDTVLVTVTNVEPVVSSPSNITYTEGDSTPCNITWIITHPPINTGNYTIRVNWGAPTAPSEWISGSTVTFDVSGWAPGTYYVEISVADESGGSTSDLVVVTVSAKVTQLGGEIDWGLILAAVQAPLIAILGIALAVLWAKVRRGQAHPTRELLPSHMQESAVVKVEPARPGRISNKVRYTQIEQLLREILAQLQKSQSK